jgi:hypothetical protein
MGPYSHIFLAAKLETCIQPDDLAQYYWGAIFPDIRYLAGMRRDQTHVSIEKIRAWQTHYPQLGSFLQGYQVHCLLDLIDIVSVVSKAFPFNTLRLILRRTLTNHQMAVLVELNFLRAARIEQFLSGSQNEITDLLQIKPAQIEAFSSGMRDYLGNPSMDTAISTYQRLGMIDDMRIKKYMHAALTLNKNKLLLNTLLHGVKKSDLEQSSLKYVRFSMQVRGDR